MVAAPQKHQRQGRRTPGYVSGAVLRFGLCIDTPAKTTGWMYLHVPLTVSIVMTGAAVLNVVEHAGEPLTPEVRWLLVGPLGWRWSALQHSSS